MRPNPVHVLLIDLADDEAAIAQYEAWHASGALPPAWRRQLRKPEGANIHPY